MTKNKSFDIIKFWRRVNEWFMENEKSN